MYEKYIKRLLDIVISFCALVILSPLLLLLTAAGAVFMSGNPFFIQDRPGKNELIFKLIKYRTMDDRRDKAGRLLTDEDRLSRYGRFLRRTSLDELPELINIIRGDMSIVGPRPLLVRYLPLYNEAQRRRHRVRPGLTGLAQVKGRNAIAWGKKLKYDVMYVDNVSFMTDLKIMLLTVKAVIKHEGVSSGTSETMEDFDGTN